MEARTHIRKYILENYLFSDDPSELEDGISLLEKGVIDSTGIMELVFFLEEEWGIEVDDEEMIPENLDSVDNIVHFVEKKLPH